jgi:hypothetical protein
MKAQARRRRSDAEDRAGLLATLQAHASERFRASELKAATGVPKARVRRLLMDVPGVAITREQSTFWFSWEGGPTSSAGSIPNDPQEVLAAQNGRQQQERT